MQHDLLKSDTQTPLAEPIDVEELREVLRGRVIGREHWVIAFSAKSRVLIDECVRRYYSTSGPEDCSIFPSRWEGRYFGIAVLRKKMMLSYQIQSLLRTLGNIWLREEEITLRDILICVPEDRIRDAMDLTYWLCKGPETDGFAPDWPIHDDRMSAAR